LIFFKLGQVFIQLYNYNTVACAFEDMGLEIKRIYSSFCFNAIMHLWLNKPFWSLHVYFLTFCFTKITAKGEHMS